MSDPAPTQRLRAVDHPQPAAGTPARLAQIADELAPTGWAYELFDADWRLVCVSDELKVLVGEHDDAKLGYGLHVLETHAKDAWACILTEESKHRMLELHAPFYLDADAKLVAEIGARSEGNSEHLEILRRATPRTPPALWASYIDFLQPDLPPARANSLGLTLQEGGEVLGYLHIYAPSMPASLLSLLVRGDVGMFARMARLARPQRVEAAILFADLQASGSLSRRLPSTAYFAYIRALTTAIDSQVVERSGLIGKHAGDGVTAFFVAEQLGSSAAAAFAALDAARMIASAAREAAEVAGLAATLTAEDCALNIGVHWGGALYMGQLVTDGRLEVTALGDDVNECARIQQSARDGALLASKAVIERLDGDGAGRLGLDPDRVIYETVGHLDGATEKAIRDAGTIPVANLATQAHA